MGLTGAAGDRRSLHRIACANLGCQNGRCRVGGLGGERSNSGGCFGGWGVVGLKLKAPSAISSQFAGTPSVTGSLSLAGRGPG
jgi:hypothetical protein